MGTTKPRLLVTLEPALHHKVLKLARDNRISMSQAAHDLIREAAEDIEDWGLVRLARQRMASVKRGGYLTHKEVWDKIKKSR